MSLINQVLKDLERRHAGTDEAAGMARAVRALPDAPRRSLWIVLGVIVTGALVGGSWWYLSQLERRAAQQAATAQAAVPPLAAAPAPAMPESASSAPMSAVSLPVNPPNSPLAPGQPGSGQAQASAAVPVVLPEKIAGLSQPQPPAPTASAAVPAGVLAPVKAGPPGADAPGALAGEPQSTAKVIGKVRPKPVDGVGKRGLPGVQAGEYPEPDGSESAPSIDKQVRPPSERERGEAEFRQGMAALQAGNAADGEDRLRAALVIDPLNNKARQALLGVYVESNRREDAERLLEDSLRVDRKHPGFAMALARLQLERGANGEALVTLQRSLPYGETSAGYQAMLANALARVGRNKEAAERYEAAARLAPRDPLWLMGLGVTLRADNRPEEARTAFRRARELGGLNPQLASFVDQQLRELK
jgi:MSHA biogenesis protein MshN